MTAAAEMPVKVEVVRTTTDRRRHASSITYRVRNGGSQDVWLVSDPWFVWRLDDNTVTVSYARGRMIEGVEVFGYFDPEVTLLRPGTRIDRNLEIGWPLRLSTVWNREASVWPEPGRYRVRIEVGFGFSPHPVDREHGDVEEVVLNWQHTALSMSRELEVPPK